MIFTRRAQENKLLNIIQTNCLYASDVDVSIYVGYYHNNIAFIELGINGSQLEQWAMIKSVQNKFPGYSFEPNLNLHKDLNEEIINMINNSNKDNINIPIVHLIGTPFQIKVWNTLAKISRGETRTYAQIAEMIGSPKSVRAVGSAIEKNNHAVYIPCHRVVPKAGGVGQYKWGSDLKQNLLEIENA